VIVDRHRIAELLPHGAGMVLLDLVKTCDSESVVCVTGSHRDISNPLRQRGRLPAMAVIEYAAQAAALHAALNGQRASGAGAVLGGVKNMTCNRARLDDIPDMLEVRVTLLLARDNGAVYSFEVGTQSGMTVAEGRFTVMYK